jgi:hypothetical protein
MHLFTHAMNDRVKSEAPLAARRRPPSLDEYIIVMDVLQTLN